MLQFDPRVIVGQNVAIAIVLIVGLMQHFVVGFSDRDRLQNIEFLHDVLLVVELDLRRFHRLFDVPLKLRAELAVNGIADIHGFITAMGPTQCGYVAHFGQKTCQIVD